MHFSAPILLIAASFSMVAATAEQYNTFQISDGVGGSAAAEAAAAFPGAGASLSGTALQDVNVGRPATSYPTRDLPNANQTEAHCAVLAEAQFISEIAAAGATTAAGKALAVGMIKNKVLKIYSAFTFAFPFPMLDSEMLMKSGTLQAVEGFIATQGSSAAMTAQQTDLTTKLATNTKLDVAAKGQASQSVSFTCP